MINIFNEVYTLLVNVLTLYDTSIKTSSEYTNTPSEYPFVSLEEIENSVHEATSDSCDIENHADIDFEVNIYTKTPNKKTKGDSILEVVDTFFKNIGFVRRSKNVFQTTNETTYHIIVRYGGVVSKDSVVYRR